MSVAPESTLAVILGASSWPDYPQLSGQVSAPLEKSAESFREYLLSPDGLHLPPGNLKDLFNDGRSTSEVLNSVADFLKDRQQKSTITDLILYFAGHGIPEGQ